MSAMNLIPDRVRGAFHVGSGPAEVLGQEWDYGVRIQQTVLSRVVDPVQASWSAKVRETIHPEGVRTVRPVRATDGRLVVSGWRASAYVEGKVAQRVDETVCAALRLADALAEVAVPDCAVSTVRAPWSNNDLFAVADRAAWSKNPANVLESGLDTTAQPKEEQLAALHLAAEITPHLTELHSPRQVGHADMLATTLYTGSNMPVVTDIVPVSRPHGYTAVQVMVDGMIAGAVDFGIIRRFAHIPEIPQLVLRATLYRLFVHTLHPSAKMKTREHMEKLVHYLVQGF